MGKENQSHQKEHYDGYSSVAILIPHASFDEKKHRLATVYEQQGKVTNRWDIHFYALKPNLTIEIHDQSDELTPDDYDLETGEPIDSLLSFISIPEIIKHENNGDNILFLFDAAFSRLSDEALYGVYIKLSDIAQEKIQYLLHNSPPPDYADRVTKILQKAIDSIE